MSDFFHCASSLVVQWASSWFPCRDRSREDAEAVERRPGRDDRVIRVLTVNSKTFYFQDKGVQRGTVVDFFKLFEDGLNKKLAAEKKLKDKNQKVRVLIVPVRRDQLLPRLAAGEGDIAAANLTITPERKKLVDSPRPVSPMSARS